MYAFIIKCYFDIIHPKKRTIKETDKIDYTNKEILQYIILGLQPKEIAEKLDGITITPDAVRKRIQRLRKDYNCENDIQFGILLRDKGIISPKLDE